MDGRIEADRIARECLVRAGIDLRAAAPSVSETGLSARLRDILELVTFVNGPDGPSPRESGHHFHVLLRHAVCALRRDTLIDTMGAAGMRRIDTDEGPVMILEGVDPGLEALARAHDAVDTAVTVMGGIADLVADPDDWLSDPEDEADLLPGDGFSGTAATAALLARDGLGLLRRNPRPEALFLLKEASALVASCLALGCALAVPEGAPRVAASAVAERGTRSFARFQESVSSWRSLGGPFPDAVLDGLTDVGAFASDVFAEVDSHARGPAPAP